MQMKVCKIFIGLPVHNGENYLEQALDSLRSQTFSDFIVLVSDNASTDRTQEISLNYTSLDDRFLYHRHEENLGAARNFNYCLEQARGEYFKWMAHDDVLHEDYLRRCVEVLDADPDASLCQSGVLISDSNLRHNEVYRHEQDFNDFDPIVRFRRAMRLNHECVSVFGVVRTRLIRRTPGIASFMGSDRSLIAELALHGRLEWISDPLFFWRHHDRRSVRLSPVERAKWFDPRASSLFNRLRTRLFFAYLAAALRAPQSAPMKMRAVIGTLIWAKEDIAKLKKDVFWARSALKASIRRSRVWPVISFFFRF